MCLPGVHARPYTFVHANVVSWSRAPLRDCLFSCRLYSRDSAVCKPSAITETIFHRFARISSREWPISIAEILKSTRAIYEKHAVSPSRARRVRRSVRNEDFESCTTPALSCNKRRPLSWTARNSGIIDCAQLLLITTRCVSLRRGSQLIRNYAIPKLLQPR